MYQRTNRVAYATGRSVSRSTPLASTTVAPRTATMRAIATEPSPRTGTGMAPSRRWERPDEQPRGRQGGSGSGSHTLRTILILGLIATYGIGMFIFATHFTPGTTVDGIDATMMTVDELTSALEERSSSYEQHITNADGFDTTIAGSDIALTSDAEHTALEAQSRTTAFLWPFNIIAPPHLLIDAGVTVDEKALSGAITKAVEAYNKKAEAPKDAHGTFDEEKNCFVVAPEEPGKAIDAEKLTELSLAATRELREEVSVTDAVLALPAVTQDNEKLNAAVTKANEQLDGRTIELTCDGETIATIDNKTIGSWVKFDDNLKLAFDGVYAWLETNETVQAKGNEETDEFVYSFEIQETCDDIHRVLEKEPGTKAELKRSIAVYKPGVDPKAKELGRHIDINLTDQYVRFYDESGKVIWESYCVTGGYDTQTGDIHRTPTGTFYIEAKDTDVVLRGADLDHDQKPDYESHVNYWMPFLNNDYGLHDADWRGDFGGDIRDYYGSHGCVNLPPDAAAELFQIVQVGDMVVVRNQDGSETTAGTTKTSASVESEEATEETTEEATEEATEETPAEQ